MTDRMIDLTMQGILYGVPLIYAALQLLALLRWRDGLRLAAMLPLLGWIGWGAVLWRDLSRDSTSHNLLPFEIVFVALGGLACLGLLLLLHRMTRERAVG